MGTRSKHGWHGALPIGQSKRGVLKIDQRSAAASLRPPQIQNHLHYGWMVGPVLFHSLHCHHSLVREDTGRVVNGVQGVE